MTSLDFAGNLVLGRTRPHVGGRLHPGPPRRTLTSMVGRRDHAVEAFPRRRTPAEALKRWTIPTIGALTPVGLIVVNLAAFVDHHLAEFRLIITALAFVSGMMLNSWAALKIYRVARRHMPSNPLVQDRNQELVLVAGMLVVIAGALLTALFCYQGLSDERSLPNKSTFITGVVAILAPILLQGLFDRALSGDSRSRRERRGGGLPPPPPPPGS